MKYDKLVRDRIPEIIRKRGVVPITHIADKNEYWEKLKAKLQEEVDEVLEDVNVEEELADVLEVIYAICDFKGISLEELELIRKKKKDERGGFKDKIILDETRELAGL
ncbi:MAG: nucleoside triphosphate pyrophosphohydrolase [Candidatus Aenigmarchaeota archaeon]|nr:nucleoside triphosphate pyrophosphohydrolase [Candidatus Aenigmarchaeota archaeon]